MEEIRLNIFIAYSREDAELRSSLDNHLSGLKRREYINTWHDGQIVAGTEWENEIEDHLSTADIILLLISSDFIASDYCYDIEMRKAISRHEIGDAVIIPILLRPCDWSDLPFSKIQGLPQNGKAISSNHWKSPDFALNEVTQSIKVIVEKLRKNKTKNLKSINEVLLEKDNELRIKLEQLEDLQLEQEIVREEVQGQHKKKKDLEQQIKILSDSKIELETSYKEKQLDFQRMIKSEQIELNKIRRESKKITNEITKAKTQIKTLEQKKINIEEDIKRIKKNSD